MDKMYFHFWRRWNRLKKST